MNFRRNQQTAKRSSKANTRTSKLKVPEAEWELADDRLDEALRQTFPASDAISIVQTARSG
jgi:hypothetical protein